MPTRRRLRALALPKIAAVALVFPTAACNFDPEAAKGAAAAAGAVAHASGQGARITALSGPGGLSSDALADGTFLGQGAALAPGQHIETPKGTLAEVELEDGVRVRLNEETSLELPGEHHPEALVLTRGEAVVLVPADGSLLVRAGNETLRVGAGEALVRNTGSTRHFAIIGGNAVLEDGTQSFELGPGESMDAPVPLAAAQEPVPELSLRPLEDTGWSRVFETAARMADAVPRGVGSLTARRPGSRAEQQKLELVDQRVAVSISGRIAHTEVEQTFFNDRAAVLEGIYRFPLPSDGSISGLSLLVGNTWMDGEVVEKQRGRRIFQQIVDATVPRDPALLEWEQGNMFKLRVFPIPGRGQRRIRLSYTQLLPVVGETLRYRFPMGGSGATGTEVGHFEMTVDIDGSGVGESGIGDIATPMLAMSRRDLGDHIELHAERDRFLPTYDLGVDIVAPRFAERVQTQTHVDENGQAYFMVSLRPDLELGADERPVHYAFVLDRSHSTTPELWTAGGALVEALVGVMDPEDRFTVLACDAACDESPEGPQAPEPAAVDRTRRFLEEQDLAGASDLGNMLVQATEALQRAGTDARQVVVYLGDGTPTSGELAADKLAKLVRDPLVDTRVLAVALGARSDLTTLGAIVKQTGGDLLRADARDDLRELVRELRLRAEVPVARDIELDLPPGLSAVHRHDVSGLRTGDSLILAGKLDHAVSGDIRLRARGPAGPVQETFGVRLTPDEAAASNVQRHLPRTWAQMEIADLTRTEGFDARERIVALSKGYTVLSRHTALLVLENDAMYREFNVVRSAKHTDGWNGQLKKAESDEAGASTRTTRETATAESKPEPEPEQPVEEAREQSLRSRSGDEKRPARERLRDAPASAHDPADLGGFFDGEPRPFPGSQPHEPAGSAPDVDGLLGGADFDDDSSEDELGPAGTGRGGGGSGGFAPPPPTKAKKRASGKSRFEPGWGSSGTVSGLGGRVVPRREDRRWHRSVRTLAVRRSSDPSARTLARIEALRRAVQADPTQRSAHGKLVRAAIRAGHPDALGFARAWAEADPEHMAALLALADVLARRGDPLSLRAYASAVEVRPFSRDQHDALAQAFASKGDLRRACSHRRAIVSIDPREGDHHAALAACLHHAGRISEARAVLIDGERRATTDVQALRRTADALDRGIVPQVRLHRSAQLRATLTWSGEDDLDIALVDARGRRLSAMRPDGIRVREDAGREELTLRRVRGSVFAEITRVASGSSSGRAGPVRGRLEIRTPHTHRTIPVVIETGSVRAAKISWRTRRR